MAAADYIAAVLADLPRGYWTLEDAGPTNAADSSGNSHTATATSITWEADGPEDSLAVGLTAPNSYLTIPDSSDWVWTDVTLEAWVYPGAAGAGGRMSVIRHQAASGPYLFLALSNLVPEVGSQPDGFIQTRGSALTADTWYHLAAVRDRTAGTWTVYLNGSQIGTTISAAGGSNIDITGNLMIGAWAGGTSNRYDGRLAHVAYYTTALSAARVAAHYNAMLSSGTNVDLDPAAETDTAPDLTPAKSLALSTPAEADSAPELTAAKATTLAAPVETDRAPALGRAKHIVLDVAAESDRAPVLGAAVTRTLDLAAEVDRALDLILPSPTPVGHGPTATLDVRVPTATLQSRATLTLDETASTTIEAYQP